MKPYETPITQQNFEKAFRYSRRKHYWVRKKVVIRSAVLTLGQLLFLGTFLILAYGVLYECSQGLLRSFIEKAPVLTEAWNRFSGILFAQALTPREKLLPMLLFLYGIPFAGALIPTVLIILFYHPISPKLSADPAQQPRDLWVLSQRIGKFRDLRKNSTFSFCSLFFGLIAVGFLICFLLYFKNEPTIHAQLQQHLGQASLYMVIGWAIGFLAYLLLNLPLQLLLLLLYGCYIPKSYYSDVDTYYHNIRLGTADSRPSASGKPESGKDDQP